MTHDTNNESPSSQDELLAHVIPMRHRATDDTHLQTQDATDEYTRQASTPCGTPPQTRRCHAAATDRPPACPTPRPHPTPDPHPTLGPPRTALPDARCAPR
jgi:hypothetical protein